MSTCCKRVLTWSHRVLSYPIFSSTQYNSSLRSIGSWIDSLNQTGFKTIFICLLLLLSRTRRCHCHGRLFFNGVSWLETFLSIEIAKLSASRQETFGLFFLSFSSLSENDERLYFTFSIFKSLNFMI